MNFELGLPGVAVMRAWVLFICMLSAQAGAQECVILLHGLARSEASMGKLEAVLSREGFAVQNVDYPSTTDVIENLAQKSIPPAIKSCPADSKIHFVTHSMGGILVRQFLSVRKLPRLGRVVMLGPPNRGSEVIDKLGRFPGFHFINGDAGLQLGTGALSVPNTLGAAEFDLGVIAGSRSVNLILSALIPGTDDGKVSVANTKLAGMNEHLVMPVTHPFMMKNDKVIQQVVHYLRTGSFLNLSDGVSVPSVN